MGPLTVLPGGAVRVSPESDDVDLIGRARDGDEDAFGELYRRYVPDAVRAARSCTRPAHLAEDVVADVFDSIWTALRNGRGPTERFKPYLITAIRNRAIRLSSQPAEGESIDDHHASLAAVDAEPAVDEGFATRAFAQLPSREREVLWLTAIEGQSPAEAARVLSLSERAAASLRFRAKRSFAELYLAERGAAAATTVACRELSPKLSRYVVGTCPPLARRNVERHLSACPSCQHVVGELQSVNSTLRSALLPGLALTMSSSPKSITPSLVKRVGTGVLRVATSKPVLAVAAAGVVAMIPAAMLLGGSPPPEPDRQTRIEQTPDDEHAPVVRPPRPEELADPTSAAALGAVGDPKRMSAPASAIVRPHNPVASPDPEPPTTAPTPVPTEPPLTVPVTQPPIVTDPLPQPTVPIVTAPPIPVIPTTIPALSLGISVASPIVDADAGLSVGANGVALSVDADVPLLDPLLDPLAIDVTIPPVADLLDLLLG